MPETPSPADSNLDPLATVALKGGLPKDALGTVKIPVSSLELPGTPPAKGWGWVPWLVGGLAAAAVATGVWVWSSRDPGPTQEVVALQGPVQPSEPLPPEVKALVKEAEGGNVHAMRTLALWYYYGLNVPRDRVRGLDWYRKAAAAGSSVARQELAQIESGQR